MSTLDQAMNYLADLVTPDSWHTVIQGLYYKKVMGVTYVRCYITNNSFTTAYKIVGNLPAGYRPIDTIYLVCGFNSGTEGIVYFANNGNIGIRINSGSAQNVWFLASFPSDN